MRTAVNYFSLREQKDVLRTGKHYHSSAGVGVVSDLQPSMRLGSVGRLQKSNFEMLRLHVRTT